MTNTMTDEEALLSHLDSHPDDWDAMRVLTDLLKEQGRDVEVEAWEYFVTREVFPADKSGHKNEHFPEHDHLRFWWVREYEECGNLPREWMETIRDETRNHTEGSCYAYNRRLSSYRYAFLAAVKAYCELSQDQRRKVQEL